MPTTPIKNKSKKTQIRPTSITTTIDDDDIHDVREWGSAISTPTKSPLSKEKKLVPQSPKKIKNDLRYRKTSNVTWDCQFSSDGKYVYYNDYYKAVVLDLEKGKEIMREETGNYKGTAAITPDSKHIVIMQFDDIQLYEIATGKLKKNIHINIWNKKLKWDKNGMAFYLLPFTK